MIAKAKDRKRTDLESHVVKFNSAGLQSVQRGVVEIMLESCTGSGFERS